MQIGDVKETFAETKELEDWIDYKPKVSIEEGVRKFAEWFKNYY